MLFDWCLTRGSHEITATSSMKTNASDNKEQERKPTNSFWVKRRVTPFRKRQSMGSRCTRLMSSHFHQKPQRRHSEGSLQSGWVDISLHQGMLRQNRAGHSITEVRSLVQDARLISAEKGNPCLHPVLVYDHFHIQGLNPQPNGFILHEGI